MKDRRLRRACRIDSFSTALAVTLDLAIAAVLREVLVVAAFALAAETEPAKQANLRW